MRARISKLPSLIIVRNWNGSLLVSEGNVSRQKEKIMVNAIKSAKNDADYILNFINFET